MTNQQKEHWNYLCAQAVKETDPKKLAELMAEIVRMLREKQDHLNFGWLEL
jgi:hypothetical protein